MISIRDFVLGLVVGLVLVYWLHVPARPVLIIGLVLLAIVLLLEFLPIRLAQK